jgi:hypothetical protein
MQGRSGKSVQLYMDPDLKEALQTLAAGNGRSLSAEIVHACLRHLAAPPRLVTPPLARGAAPHKGGA